MVPIRFSDSFVTCTNICPSILYYVWLRDGLGLFFSLHILDYNRPLRLLHMDASLATVLTLPKLDEAESQDVYTLCVLVHALVWHSWFCERPSHRWHVTSAEPERPRLAFHNR